MFPTKETEFKSPKTDSVDAKLTFDSIDQFAAWLDAELEVLVSQFSNFETETSVHKFFNRS